MLICRTYLGVAEPVAGSVKTFDCNSGSMQAGAACTDPSAATFQTVTCYGASMSCPDDTFDALAFSTIGNAIRIGYPFIDNSNIVVEYRDSRLGFAGRPGVIPIVEVRLTGVPYNFLVLDLLRPLIFAPGSVPDQITMPDATATLSGEDMAFKF